MIINVNVVVVINVEETGMMYKMSGDKTTLTFELKPVNWWIRLSLLQHTMQRQHKTSEKGIIRREESIVYPIYEYLLPWYTTETKNCYINLAWIASWFRYISTTFIMDYIKLNINDSSQWLRDWMKLVNGVGERGRGLYQLWVNLPISDWQ